MAPISILHFGLWRFSQTDPRSSPILVDELDAGANEHTLYFGQPWILERGATGL
jgi:hypothetical protein